MSAINLLGTTSVTTAEGNVRIVDAGGVKPRQILELLALSHTVAVGKDELAEALWDGRPPATYGATLESHVSVVRRYLSRLGVPREAIATVHNGYVLTNAVDVDLSDLRGTLRSWREASAWPLGAGLAWLVQVPAVRLLASSPYAGWAVAAREDLDDELARCLRQVSSTCASHGDLTTAATCLIRARQIDPLSEHTQLLLLQILRDRGTPIDALRSFGRFRRRLRDELGAEPGPQMVELYLSILRALSDRATDLDADETSVLRGLLAQASSSGHRTPPAPRPVSLPVPALAHLGRATGVSHIHSHREALQPAGTPA